jgi:hypothetical protein
MTVSVWGRIYSQNNYLHDVKLVVEFNSLQAKKNKVFKGVPKDFFLDSQFCLDLGDDSDSIGTVSIRNGGVLFSGVIAEQEHLFAVQRVLWPSDVR